MLSNAVAKLVRVVEIDPVAKIPRLLVLIELREFKSNPTTPAKLLFAVTVVKKLP